MWECPEGLLESSYQSQVYKMHHTRLAISKSNSFKPVMLAAFLSIPEVLDVG